MKETPKAIKDQPLKSFRQMEDLAVEQQLNMRRGCVLAKMLKENPSEILWTPPEAPEETSMRCVVELLGGAELTAQGIPIPREVAVGDIILIPRHTGATFTWNGEPAAVLHESEILAILK